MTHGYILSTTKYVPSGTLFLGFQPGCIQSDKTNRRRQTESRLDGFEIGSKIYWTAVSYERCEYLNLLSLDGKAIEENGKYVDPELAAICKKMGVAGY